MDSVAEGTSPTAGRDDRRLGRTEPMTPGGSTRSALGRWPGSCGTGRSAGVLLRARRPEPTRKALTDQSPVDPGELRDVFGTDLERPPGGRGIGRGGRSRPEFDPTGAIVAAPAEVGCRWTQRVPVGVIVGGSHFAERTLEEMAHGAAPRNRRRVSSLRSPIGERSPTWKGHGVETPEALRPPGSRTAMSDPRPSRATRG